MFRALPLLLLLSLLPASSGAAPRYVLTVTPGGSEVRVVLGSKLLRFQGSVTRTRTITSMLPVGENFVRLGWTSLKSPAEVVIARVENDEAHVLLRYRVDGVLKPRTGAVNLSVVRDDRSTGGVYLRAFMQKGIARVTLNGQSVGDVASIERRDVSAFVRKGRNVMDVAWSKDFGGSFPSGGVRLTFGNVTLASWNASKVETVAGTHRLTFQFTGASTSSAASKGRAPGAAKDLQSGRE